MQEYLHEFYVFAFGAMAAIIVLAIGVAVTEADMVQWLASFSRADFATLISGFGGAALGGLISWILAKEAGRETLARDEAQRRADQKAMALAITLKVQHIANGVTTLRKHFYTSRRAANAAGRISRPLWETLKPVISNAPSRVRFDPAEFAPLVSARRPDLIDRCNLIALRFDVDETVMNDYSTRRGAMHEMLAAYSELSGPDGLVTTVIPPELQNQFIIKGKELEDIIRHLYASVREDAQEARELCNELTSTFRKHFGEDVFPLETADEDT